MKVSTFLLSSAVVVFVSIVLGILARIDHETRRLPNTFVGALFVAGIISVFMSVKAGEPLLFAGTSTAGHLWSLSLSETVASASFFRSSPFLFSLTGMLAGFFVPLTIDLLYRAMRGRAGFGAGDIKLLAALGLFVGPGVLLLFCVASMLSLTGEIAKGVWRRFTCEGDAPKRAPLSGTIAFGPFLAAAFPAVLALCALA